MTKIFFFFQIFTVIFILEAVLKIFALGPVVYASDPWNDFDFIIVFISIVELILSISRTSRQATGLTVLRTLRLVGCGEKTDQVVCDKLQLRTRNIRIVIFFACFEILDKFIIQK